MLPLPGLDGLSLHPGAQRQGQGGQNAAPAEPEQQRPHAPGHGGPVPQAEDHAHAQGKAVPQIDACPRRGAQPQLVIGQAHVG